DLERRLMEGIGVIADRTVQAEYRRFVRDRLFELARPAKQGSYARARPTFVRDGPEPPRRPGRLQRENLFRILLAFPWLIDEVAEEFAAFEIPEPEFDRLRREILAVKAPPAGLDACALRQHLVQNGLAATVDGLLLPS